MTHGALQTDPPDLRRLLQTNSLSHRANKKLEAMLLYHRPPPPLPKVLTLKRGFLDSIDGPKFLIEKSKYLFEVKHFLTILGTAGFEL